ncbi:MAG: hypothetical protein J1G05_06230 [Clostridiales bacterium]|nr:hypothetical protein [Clostridiales bacterium]
MSEKRTKRVAVKKTAPNTKEANSNTVTSNRLKLLITIVNRSKADFYTDLIQSYAVNMQMVLMARGTANAKMLNLLGLADNEKAVILSVIQESQAEKALLKIDEKFRTIKDGKGVAFTIPLTSVIGALIYGFLSDNIMMVK